MTQTMNDLRTVAVLCAAKRSAYKSLPGVEVYDAERDARTFTGGMPIVAHPPCRAWSAYCAHQAKPEPGERELGLWCCDQLRECGGVLEQPAHSRLFAAGGLPLPNEAERRGLWSIRVWQWWWGFELARKNTWLCFAHVPREAIEVPFRLLPSGFERRRWQVVKKSMRSHTVPAFAEWLVSAARQSSLVATHTMNAEGT